MTQSQVGSPGLALPWPQGQDRVGLLSSFINSHCSGVLRPVHKRHILIRLFLWIVLVEVTEVPLTPVELALGVSFQERKALSPGQLTE